MNSQIRNTIINEAKNNANFISKDVNLDDYLLKIDSYGLFHSSISNNNLRGFVAFYANDMQSLCGFITMIIVNEQYRGKGIAKKLIQSACDTMKALRMKRCGLEVLRCNYSAINLYESIGFNIVVNKSNDDVIYMNKLL